MKTGSFIRFFLLIPGNLLALILACLGVNILQTNLLGWFLLLFGVAYMAGGAIFLWPKNAPLITKSTLAARDEVDDRSFWLILPGFLMVFFGSPLEYICGFQKIQDARQTDLRRLYFTGKRQYRKVVSGYGIVTAVTPSCHEMQDS